MQLMCSRNQRTQIYFIKRLHGALAAFMHCEVSSIPGTQRVSKDPGISAVISTIVSLDTLQVTSAHFRMRNGVQLRLGQHDTGRMRMIVTIDIPDGVTPLALNINLNILKEFKDLATA